VANLDIESDEHEQVSQQLSSRMGNCVFQTEQVIKINNIKGKKEISRKSKISEDIRSLDLLRC
jgi:hypothetical protein